MDTANRIQDIQSGYDPVFICLQLSFEITDRLYGVVQLLYSAILSFAIIELLYSQVITL